jgi:hypothetical protein
MAGMSILVLVPLIYGIIAINTGDLLWASPIFNGQPSAVVLYCYGKAEIYKTGTVQYAELNQRFNSALSGRKHWDDTGLSDATYQDYQTSPDMMVLMMLYAEPVRVHSNYKFFSKVDTLIIPLVGRHASTNAIFGKLGQYPAAGSFHITTTAPLTDYITSQDLCHKP